MKKAIYYRLIILTFISVVIYGLIAASITTINNQNEIKDWLTKLTFSTSQMYYYNNDVDFLSTVAGNNRVTIISNDGIVEADSSSAQEVGQSRSDREEFIYANEDVFIAIRTSATIGEQFMYATIVTNDGNILRIAHSHQGFIYNFFTQLPAMFIATVVAGILSLFLATKFTTTVTTPLEDVRNALSAKKYEGLRNYEGTYLEIDDIMRGIDLLLQQLSKSRRSLNKERDKVEHVLSSMAEGFVLIDHNEKILLCNHSVKSFFEASADLTGQNLLNLINDKTINLSVEKALTQQLASSFEFAINDDLILTIYVSPTNDRGATLLFVDDTNSKQLEQQKQDFFSNASHELKTPITSILGFSEMINNDIITDEDVVKETLGRIETEARRMTDLINNILAISNLESHVNSHKDHEYFNFSEVLKEAVQAVSPFKDGNKIEVDLTADDLIVLANQSEIYDLCVNLIENAVKYNKPDGKVIIDLKQRKNNAVLKVKDTGIGIPTEQQNRVFERFFRVDYGRDKKTGGSGLGLSIVKHIVGTYHGEISLKSKKNIGTTFKVSLPIINEKTL